MARNKILGATCRDGKFYVVNPDDGREYELKMPAGDAGSGSRKVEVTLYTKNGQVFAKAGGKEIALELPEDSKLKRLLDEQANVEPGSDGNAIEEAAKKRFAAEVQLRRMYGVTVDDPNSDQYAAGLARYVTAERRYAVDLTPERQREQLGAVVETADQTKSLQDADLDKTVSEAATKRFASEPSVRRMFGVMFDDPNSDQYKAGLARYLAAERKNHADQDSRRQTEPLDRVIV